MRVPSLHILVLVLSLSGCAGTSPPTEFYTLAGSGAVSATRVAAPAGSGAAVGIGPVRLPAMLDRPMAVKRGAQVEIIARIGGIQASMRGRALDSGGEAAASALVPTTRQPRSSSGFIVRGSAPIDVKRGLKALRVGPHTHCILA